MSQLASRRFVLARLLIRLPLAAAAVILFAACGLATAPSDGERFATEYKAQIAQFQVDFDSSGQEFAKRVAEGDLAKAAQAADAAIAAIDRLIGWQRAASVPSGSPEASTKIDCEKNATPQLRSALAAVRDAALRQDAAALAVAEPRVGAAIQSLDQCAGSTSSSELTRQFAVSPKATSDPVRVDLEDFARSYKTARLLDRDSRLTWARQSFPSPSGDLKANAFSMAAFFDGYLLIPNGYERLSRTPSTRAFVDGAAQIDVLQRDSDEANRDSWLARARGDSGSADQLATRADSLSDKVKRGWTELEDAIDDALRAHGSSWTAISGRP